MIRYLRFLSGFIVLGLLVLMGLNVYLDPFRIYHAPVTPVAYSHIDRYRVAGLINESLYRNKDTDTVLIGTSMSDNTDVDDLAKKLGTDKILKLILSGGLPEEHILIVNHALRSQQVKTVYWELHSYFSSDKNFINDKDMLTIAPWRYFPSYLYDRSYLNDFPYLLSQDSFQNFKKIKEELHKGQDNMQGWAFKDKGTQKAYNAWSSNDNKNTIKENILKRDQSGECIKAPEFPSVNIMADFITKYPDVEFLLFIPPVHFSSFATQGKCSFENALDAQRQMADRIFKQKNAKLYAYGDREDIVLPFSNYKDQGHYMPAINTRFMTDMAKGKGQITPENIDRYFARMRDIYETGMARSDIDKPAP